MNDLPRIFLKDVSLVKGNKKIINRINFKMSAGEIHGLVGDRGTGKSTIGAMMALKEIPDNGTVFWEGKAFNFFSFLGIKNPGVEMIHQDGGLLDHFSVAENIFLPQKIFHPFPFNGKNKAIALASDIIGRYGFDIDPSLHFYDLSMSEKAIIEILRCITKNPKLLIIDEALEKLTGDDFEKVAKILKAKASEGMGILCISHRIDDIYGLAEKVSIVRNGKILLTDSTKNIDRLNLIKLCYTQVSRTKESEDVNKEFYQILRYNEAVLKSLPISLIVTDEQSRIKMINDQAMIFFNVQQMGYLNKPLGSIIEESESLEQIKDCFNDVEESSLYNVKIGKTKSNIKVFPIFDGKFPIGNIVILEDITEQENMRQRLNLSENLASIGLLAAGVAHEINNPLEIIYNYINFLRMNPKVDELNNVVNLLEEEMDGIKYIVSNLMSFSSKEENHQGEFDLNQLVSQTLTLLKPSAETSNIKCHFISSDDKIMLKASKIEIRQVILNLIKNSFEVLSDGGTVEVETDRDDELTILKIRDDGPGINEDNIHDILLPFYSNKTGTKNMGLGLTMSYGIINKYKGEFTYSNLEDGGCEFVIRIPNGISFE